MPTGAGEGAAALYGPPTAEPVGDLATPSLGSSHRVFVDRAQSRFVGPFEVAPGTLFTATMTGIGDTDLYVRFEEAPDEHVFDCRPFETGSTEECRLEVPAGVSRAFVMVRGWEAGGAQLEVAYDGEAYEGAPVDDYAPILTLVNTLPSDVLRTIPGLDESSVLAIGLLRPFIDLDLLLRILRVEQIVELHRYRSAAEAEAATDEARIVAVANAETLEVLDVVVGLDRRAAQGIVANRPFATIAELDAVPYVGERALEQLLSFARREEEPPPAPEPVDADASVLEVANTASFEALDDEVSLDVRAARGIVESRPFATIAELDAVPFVGPSALSAMLAYAESH